MRDKKNRCEVKPGFPTNPKRWMANGAYRALWPQEKKKSRVIRK